MEKRRVELLAPAGNAEGFYGAVRAGADAVYLAGERFGARAYAENFTAEELVECIRYAHLLGRRVYLAVNTLLKEEELGELGDYLSPFYGAGLDAVIVQDLGVLRFVREQFPGLRIHVSTQMTLCGSWGAALLKSMGADRIVPARELSLRELASIRKAADIEIETFVHGAMCYCYSGQCLFSSVLGGRSGNRGRCAQPCRLPYRVHLEAGPGGGGNAACYPLSLKDLCAIEILPQLIEAGIDSFKIEGRMKKPEYAAGVTSIYRRYIDRYCALRERQGDFACPQGGRAEGRGFYHVDREDLERLRSLYIRSEVQDGYYFRQSGREMITLDSPAYSGSDGALLEEIRRQYLGERLKLPIAIQATFQAGRPAEVALRCRGAEVAVTGATVEPARKQPITAENVKSQLGKLGESAFSAEEVTVSVGEGCFYPLKEMNELRRAGVAELERQLLLAQGYGAAGRGAARENMPGVSGQGSKATSDPSGHGQEILSGAKAYAISLCTREQLEAAMDWFSAGRTDVPLRFYTDCALLAEEGAEPFCRLSGLGKVYIALPYILREQDREGLEKIYIQVMESGLFHGFLARSMDGLGFLRERESGWRGKNMTCRADAGLYVWNRSAAQELSPALSGFCLPYELRSREQQVLLDGLPWEKIVYGRIPMMVTANCLFRTAGRCRNEKSGRHYAELEDRYHVRFPAVADCGRCMNILYNSVPLSLHRELTRWRGRADLRVDFTLESASEVRQVLDSFISGAPFPQREYTAGHERRGVE